MRNMWRMLIIILGIGLLVACASPATLDEEVDAGNVTGIDEPLLPDSDEEEEGTAASAPSGDDDEMEESASTPRGRRGDDDDDADDDGPRACPEGWQARIAQADIGSDPRLCGLPAGICANIARGKPVPPGIRRNAEACGIDVDALVSQLAG